MFGPRRLSPPVMLGVGRGWSHTLFFPGFQGGTLSQSRPWGSQWWGWREAGLEMVARGVVVPCLLLRAYCSVPLDHGTLRDR